MHANRFVLVVVLLSALTASAQTQWFVDVTNCTEPGTGAQQDPFCRIQQAIEAAADGDSVLAMPGTYFENLDFLGKAIRVVSVAGPESTLLLQATDTQPTVQFVSGEGLHTVLEGFAFTTTAPPHVGYEAIHCAASSPTIRGNVITLGQIVCRSSGAALVGNTIQFGTRPAVRVSEDSSVTMRANLIERNRWGVSAVDSSLVLVDNTFLCNTLSGVFISRGDALTMLRNTVESNHGGVSISEVKTATLLENSIVGNSVTSSSTSRGGGLFVTGVDQLVVRANTIRANGASIGGGLYVFATSVRLENNLIDDNGAFSTRFFGRGGGFEIEGTSIWILGNSIRGNRTVVRGPDACGSSGGGWIAGGDLVFADNIVEGNVAFDDRQRPPCATFAGGLGFDVSSAFVRGNTFCANDAPYDDGMHGTCQGSLDFRDNTVEANAGDGATVECGGQLVVTSNHFIGNDGSGFLASSDGDGSFVDNTASFNNGHGMAVSAQGNGWFMNNTVCGNTKTGYSLDNQTSSARLKLFNDVIADNAEGGLSASGSGIILANCTITRNHAGAGTFGGARFSNSATIVNSIVWGNLPAEAASLEFLEGGEIGRVQYCDIGGGWPGANNIDADPVFVNPVLGDFRLRLGSPCIDRGSNSTSHLPESDFEGHARILNGGSGAGRHVDMGADEVPPGIAVRFGTVGAGKNGLFDVLSVNGSAGDHERVVRASSSSRLELRVDPVDPALGRARFVIYAWRDEPLASTTTRQPSGLGFMGFPTPLAGAEPQPIRIWNNLGRASRFGHATHPSSPAPSVIFRRRADSPLALRSRLPVTMTFQGFIEDADSAAEGPLSVTNAIVVEIVP